MTIPSAIQVYEVPREPLGNLPPIPTAPGKDAGPPATSSTVQPPPAPQEGGDTLPLTGFDALIVIGAVVAAGGVGAGLRRLGGRP